MPEENFAVGQRWVSHTESELGLGCISEVQGRSIEVSFPAADAIRRYAVNNAPLARVRFEPNDIVFDQSGNQLIVQDYQEHNNCLIYACQNDQGTLQVLPEQDLQNSIQFRDPGKRLFIGQIDKNKQFVLRRKALEYDHLSQKSPLYGLMGARVQLLPHQIYIAAQAAQRLSPRLLLADEVGLGKTIEAGLIMHQQWLAGRARRVLVIVPEPLLHQWLVEMLRRFNLHFTLIDAERFTAIHDSGENPFESNQLILTSMKTLLSDTVISSAVTDAQWDMLVVDEAHHLQWQAEKASADYQLVAKLSELVPAVLLLTATPQQTGLASHFARLRLLDPARFSSLAQFEQEEQAYQQITMLIECLLTATDVQSLMQSTHFNALTEKLDQHTLQKLLEPETFAIARQQAFRQLLDYFGTGRLLYRNTRQNVGDFPKRILQRYPLPEDTTEQPWPESDPRIDWLLSWLQSFKPAKALLICQQAEMASELEAFLRVRHGLRTAVFHENMSLLQRDRAAAYFAEQESGAQLLICSEIGSEGRNFQFCHDLVCLDLPQHPDILEQRIGRLDRIGQRHPVTIHVPYIEHSAQHHLLDWYDKGMDAFSEVQTIGENLYQQFSAQLQSVMVSPQDDVAIKALIRETRQQYQILKTQEQTGREKLLAWHSFDPAEAENLLAELESASRPIELADFISDFCDAFGIDHQSHSADTVILMPSEQMQQQDLPALPEEGITGTFQRHKALSREDIAFFSWEHPLIRSAIDTVLSHELGNTAFCTLTDERFPAGTLLIESLCYFDIPAPPGLHSQRYLPCQYRRLVLDEKGRQLTESLPSEILDPLAGRIDKPTARQLVSHARNQIELLIRQTWQTLQHDTQKWINSANHAVEQEINAEVSRLETLQSIQGNSLKAEISLWQHRQSQLLSAISTGQWRLDAIRVIIVTNN
ncbi:RNA polymerase associated protein RapA [Methylophaga frappieri]|uniref:RNA polymerase-associated protein RapA n=1 Tax=Methylophaga frappieri (strain ATCC BAA-2434 / DSM 25690 / JAM7) TaxID=754477 RepID=I1YE58_METFJ|nr:SNF2-related protein [Methylophaga frappieri]AFJ01201.1 RNA polymerase associated protein RapA [Methylophaga frappieri]